MTRTYVCISELITKRTLHIKLQLIKTTASRKNLIFLQNDEVKAVKTILHQSRTIARPNIEQLQRTEEKFRTMPSRVSSKDNKRETESRIYFRTAHAVYKP